MLSIGKLGRGQERYYLDKVAEGAEDYYSGEAEGYWLGDAAEDLGLQGKVDPDQLVGMLTGRNPATGEPLGLRHVEVGRVAIAEVEAALTAHASHFDRRDAIQAVADSLPAGAPGPEVVELADAYLATPGVIPIAETPRGERFTTRAIWELSKRHSPAPRRWLPRLTALSWRS